MNIDKALGQLGALSVGNGTLGESTVKMGSLIYHRPAQLPLDSRLLPRSLDPSLA